MTIMLHPSGRARFPLCTGIIEMSGACRNAGPFFMSRSAAGRELTTCFPTNSEGCTMTSQDDETSKADAAGKDVRRVPFSRKRVVSRLWRTAERQVTEIETRMAGIGDDPLALERDAKTLAIIAKTVRDLVTIDGEASEQANRNRVKEHAPAHGSKSARTDPLFATETDAGEFGPRDIEGFRTELARRLDDLRRERAGDKAP
jgi:hypothetical protein